jgi:hypothetical protein
VSRSQRFKEGNVASEELRVVSSSILSSHAKHDNLQDYDNEAKDTKWFYKENLAKQESQSMLDHRPLKDPRVEALQKIEMKQKHNKHNIGTPLENVRIEKSQYVGQDYAMLRSSQS